MANDIDCRYKMLRAGYTFRSVAECKGCGAKIEWWRTNNNKPIPYDPVPEDEHAKTTPHWATCPKRDQFKSKAAAAQEAKVSRDDAALALCVDTKARAVIAIYDDGNQALAWRRGIPGEDLKQDLITAANKLAYQVVMQGGTRV